MRGRKLLLLSMGIVLLAAVFFWSAGSRGQEAASASAIGTVKVEGMLNVRTGPGTNYKKATSGGTGVTLSNGMKVTIVGVNGGWYHIKFKQNGKTVKGYVNSAYIRVQTGSVYCGADGLAGSKGCAVRKKASAGAARLKVGGSAVKLARDQKVTILSESLEKTEKWYHVSFTYKNKTRKGYVLSKDIALERPPGGDKAIGENSRIEKNSRRKRQSSGGGESGGAEKEVPGDDFRPEQRLRQKIFICEGCV